MVLGVLGLCLSISAIYISKQANSIAFESKNISKESLTFSRDSRSQLIAENAYNEIYKSNENRTAIEKIKKKTIVGRKTLLSVVDQLEGVGSLFCQGSAWKWHINTILKNTLEPICNSDEVYKEFSGRKNGVSILCEEFFPESIFAGTLKTDNLNTCLFYDSGVFPSSKWNK